MINKQTFSLEEIEKGKLISFPIVSGIKTAEPYILYFDTPVLLPENAGTSVEFKPSSSYSMIGSPNFTPKIFIQIKSVYRIQTRTLLRLIIKDITNNIVHTNYVMIIGLPESSVNISARLLVPGTGNTGPNGGSILSIQDTNQSTENVSVNDTVKGPGIPTNSRVTIRSIINSTQVELSSTINITQELSGTYTISKIIDCVDPTTITNQLSSTSYTILNYDNNWTYRIRNQIIAQFLPENPSSNQDLVVLLPIRNASLIAKDDTPWSIPGTTIVKTEGLRFF